MPYADNARAHHQSLVSRVQSMPPEQAKRALLHLLEFMNNSDRFVPGAAVYDSYIRDLIEDSTDS